MGLSKNIALSLALFSFFPMVAMARLTTKLSAQKVSGGGLVTLIVECSKAGHIVPILVEVDEKGRTRKAQKRIAKIVLMTPAGPAVKKFVFQIQTQKVRSDSTAVIMVHACGTKKKISFTVLAPRTRVDGISPIPAKGFFAKNNPKVVVLVHGMTPERPIFPGGAPIGTLRYAREYWSYGFIQEVMASKTLYTFSGKRLSAQGWNQGSSNIYDCLLTSQRIATTSKGVKVTPQLSVMMTYRDGSKTLLEQTKATIEQIHTLYNKAFGRARQPQIILIAHSMGGLVARYILTCPEGTQDREKYLAIRNRTVCLFTLATPHEGSPLASVWPEVYRRVNGARPPFVHSFFLLLQKKPPLTNLMDGFSANTPATRDLRRGLWHHLNTGALAPQYARREDGKSLSLIPIYVSGCRTPGGRAFESPNVKTAVDKLNGMALADVVWHMKNIAMDDTFFNGLGKSWGTPPKGSKNLDWVRRTYILPTFQFTAYQERPSLPAPLVYLTHRHWQQVGVNPLSAFIPAKPVIPQTDSSYHPQDRSHDREVDNDGLVGLDSALGIRLGTKTNEYFAHSRTWKVKWTKQKSKTVRGSWYRIYSGPWNWHNHSTVTLSAAVGRWLHQNIVAKAGPWNGPSQWSTWTEVK